MASFFSSSTIGAYGDRMQMFGLASEFDTKTMLEAELNLLQLRQRPQYDKRTSLEKEQKLWSDIKTRLEGFQKKVSVVKDLTSDDKNVKMSSDGYFSVKASSSAVNGVFSVTVDQIATNQRVMSDKQEEGALGIETTANINGNELTITNDMSLRDIAKELNSGEFGVSAIVLDGQLVLTSNETGSGQIIEFEGELWDQLGITDNGVIKNEIQEGKDAIYSINGVQMTSSSNTVSTLDGVEITLLQETSKPITMEVDKNVENIVEKTKEMIDSYNEIITMINQLSGEGGELQGERIPRNLKRAMNEAVYGIQKEGKYMFDLGIGIDGNAKNGKIELNEETFLSFLESDPGLATELLSGTDGFSSKLNQILDSYVNPTGEIESEKNGIESRLKTVNNSIEKFEIDFERQKDVLIKKYATFEVMMNSLSMQQDYLLAQLGQFELDAKN